MKSFFIQLTPYLFLGVAAALFIIVCILLSYLLVWGTLIGLSLWAIMRIKRYFAGTAQSTPSPTKPTGRIIEHDNDAQF